MPTQLEDELGDILEKARDGKSWTQNDLAEATGIPLGNIVRMESYELIPEDNVIETLANALDLHAPSLVDVARGAWVPKTRELDSDPSLELVCLNVLMGSYPVKCYLLICKETRTTAVFDTGGNPGAVIKAARERNLVPAKIILTHAHPDHAGGLHQLDREFNCPTYIDNKELKPTASRNLIIAEDGETLQLGRLKIKCLATPGHTSGGMSYLVNNILISGDVIFAGSMGRANASWTDLFNSVTQTVLALPDETRICPGHGPATTVGEEKLHNPFFCGKV